MSQRLPLSIPPRLPTRAPDLVPLHKAAILAAIRWAWKELRQTQPELLMAADEESITAALQALLNEWADGRRRARWIQDFGVVERSAKQTGMAGQINKQPDLSFRPVRYEDVSNTTGWGWFVECKILDDTHPIRDYRDKGVRRFTDSEYAAGMPSGAMLGYVRDGSMPMSRLPEALDGRVGTVSVVAGGGEEECLSKHQRIAALNGEAHLFALTHLWLDAVRPIE